MLNEVELPMSVYTDAENSSNRHPPLPAEICQNRTKCGNNTTPHVVTYAWPIRTRHQLPSFWVGKSMCKSGLIAFDRLSEGVRGPGWCHFSTADTLNLGHLHSTCANHLTRALPPHQVVIRSAPETTACSSQTEQI